MKTKDKIWCLNNLSSVLIAKEISEEVMFTMDSLNQISYLGGNSEGGVFDAFRHIYWMYSLSNEIGPKKAKRIGEIYENYGEYMFNNSYMSGYDSVGRVMDLFNNDIGISLSKEKIPYSLIFNEIENILRDGSAKVVKKNDLGESLDIDGNVIQDTIWKQTWQNNRILINSSL
ncbi:MAG: hypothetical protein HUK18_06160 [Bacteroidales bacterium]|nr:hypothetical protein [Bacteroidales bacterium]